MPMQIVAVSIKTELISRPNPETTVYYPIVYGLESPESERKINYGIQSKLRYLLDEMGYLDSMLKKMEGWYELKTNEKGVLSLSLFMNSYRGGTHGAIASRSLTFDITSGRQYVLEDLFKTNSNYIERLSQMVGQEIKERKIHTFNKFEKIAPNQTYYIADRTLVIYFHPYEIAAYTEGFLYFPISLYDIEEIINDQGPLGRMMYEDYF
jgi:hypothetical protein